MSPFSYTQKGIIRMDNTFEKDLKRGRFGEELVSRTFEALGYELKDVSDDSDFWIEDVDYLTADGIKYEVKTDYRFHSTGNLALESAIIYKSYQEEKLSWLWTSKADYFCFVDAEDDTKFYTISSKDLRHLVKTEHFRRVLKDDGYKFIDLYLLPLLDYIECFNVIETA